MESLMPKIVTPHLNTSDADQVRRAVQELRRRYQRQAAGQQVN